MKITRPTKFVLVLALAGAVVLMIAAGTPNRFQDILVKGTATIGTLAVTSFSQTNIDAGSSGTAGTIDIYPATASKGKIALAAANNAANHTVTITNASHGQATAYTILDCGQAAANFVMSQGAATIAGIKTLSSLLNADGGIAVDTTNFTVSGTTGAVHGAGDFDIATSKFTVAAATGNTAIAGAATVTGAVTAGSDVTLTRTLGALPAATTGSVIGVPRVKIVALSTGTNGAAAGKTDRAMMDDTPDGEWTAIDGDVVRTADVSYAREGTKSIKLAIAATADATDGVTNTAYSGDWSADESFGFWIYSTKALAAGDLLIHITDSSPVETDVNVPAVAAANTWTWVECDISGIADASKNDITDLAVTLSAAGAVQAAAGAFDVYIDSMTKWDSTEEDALTISGTTGILNDGCLSVFTVAGAGLVEYTDYIVHYQSGAADAIVYITDQSAATSFAYVAY